MHYLPIDIWNTIAEKHLLLTPWARVTFAFTDARERDRWLQIEANQLLRLGYNDAVIMAYQDILPTFLENEAMKQYEKAQHNYEVITIGVKQVRNIYEAVKVIEKDYVELSNPVLIQQLKYLLRRKVIAELWGFLDPWELTEMLEENRPYSYPTPPHVTPIPLPSDG